MNDSGYFSLDKLPRHTALGYIKDETNQNWRTNAYSIPIKGGLMEVHMLLHQTC